MSKKWLSTLAVFTIFSIIFLSPTAAHAAQQQLTISPTASNQSIEPGSVTTGSFQVVNQGDGSYTFHVYATPYFVSGEDYSPEFTPIRGRPNVTDWFRFSVTEAPIQPGQAVTVSYKLTVPKTTPAGGYYAVAFAETQLPKAKEGITLNERVGQIFYLRIAGDVKEQGKLLSWKANLLQESPLLAVARLENDGAVHYTSNIEINVRDIFGKPKYTLKTNKVILPQTIRKITAKWTKAPPIGLFKVNGTATVLGQTKVLPTQYVLIMSKTVRLVLLVIVAIFIVFMVRSLVSRHKRASRAAKGK